jgi:hypothetical protein
MIQIKVLDMVRRIRDAQYEQTKDMSREELKEYFRRESARMATQIKTKKVANKSAE